MKNIFLKLIVAVFTLFVVKSCTEYDEHTAVNDSLLHFMKTAETATFYGATQNGDHKIEYGVTKATTSSNTVELVFDPAKSTAVLGTHFTIIKGTDELLSGETKGDFGIAVTPAGAGKKAVFNLKSNTLGTASFKTPITITFASACPSALAGTYAYSTTNFQVPGSPVIATPITGNVTLANSTSGGYTISDAAFGVYVALYNAPDNILVTGIRLVDTCGKLSFAGQNIYGDTWSISNVVVNGSNLTFNWLTSYNEKGTTTLTRTDGTNWPTNLH